MSLVDPQSHRLHDIGFGAYRLQRGNKAENMKSTSIIPNTVAENGFIIGFDAVAFGNCLSCFANLFCLSERIGVPVIYSHLRKYSGAFEGGMQDKYYHDPRKTLDLVRADKLLAYVDTLFDGGFDNYEQRVQTVRIEDIRDYKAVSGAVLFVHSNPNVHVFYDMLDYEEDIREFCSRGNGLVFPRVFWYQYMNMRLMKPYGDRLREHIGRVDTVWFGPSASRLEEDAGRLKIAIHMRQNDYRDWNGGRYFFNTEEYVAICRAIHISLSDKDHVFYIFSDEEIRSDLFDGLPVSIRRGRPYEDFACLSACDYVIGPPSTFATWAAFLGKRKRLVLDRPSMERPDQALNELLNAVEVPFPTGGYLPSAPFGGPV